MTGKRYSTQLFGAAPVQLGQLVFVTTSEGRLIAGYVHHILDTVERSPRERIFVAYATGPGWDDEPRIRVVEFPFWEAPDLETANRMPPGHWTLARSFQEVPDLCPCASGKAFRDCHGQTEEPASCVHEKVYAGHVLTSDPPQHPWICAKCKARGTDSGGPVEMGRRYQELMAEPGNRDQDRPS